MNQFKFGDHVKHPKHKGKLIFIESFEEVSLLKKEWAEVLSEEAGDFVFVPLEELEPEAKKKHQLPNIAISMGINFLNRVASHLKMGNRTSR